MVSRNTGNAQDSAHLVSTDTLFLDFAIINSGSSASGPSHLSLLVDGSFYVSDEVPSLAASAFAYLVDYNIGSLPAGTHTITVVADSNGEIAESNEADNSYTKTISISDLPNLTPYTPAGWSDRIVVSNASGTSTDSASLLPTDTLYVDWAVINAGGSAPSATFYVALYVDGTLTQTFFYNPPLNPNFYFYWQDYGIGSLPTGTHTIKVVADYNSVIGESDETDNAYSKTIFILNPSPQISVSAPAVTVTCAGGPMNQMMAMATSPTESPDQKLIRPAEIQAGFAANGTSEVIVNLRPAPNAPRLVNFDLAPNAKLLRDAVHDHIDKVLAQLDAADYTLRHRLDNQPSCWIHVTPAGLKKLQDDPDVDSIESVYEVPALMAHALPLIGGLVYRSIYDGSGVSIAIVDSGVDYTHPKLGGGGFPNAKVIGGYDFGNGDADPAPFNEPHGTECAGIAAGDLGSAGDYIGGVAPGARLYALKAMTDGESGAHSAAIASAWDWCVTHKNDDPSHPILVISASFGGRRFFATCDDDDPAVTAAANNAVAAGITVVAGSGNDGYCDSMISPACISSIISVGAVYDLAVGVFQPCISTNSCVPGHAGSCWFAIDNTAPDLVTSYSNSAGFLTLLAPGSFISTTDVAGFPGDTTGDYFAGFTGTSAATPFVAGAAAVLQSVAKARTGSYLTPQEVRSRLSLSGDPVTDPKNSLVKPRLNIARAIDQIEASNCFKIYNLGHSTLQVTSIDMPLGMSLSPVPPYSLAPGATQDVCVQACGACSSGDLDGVLTIHSNDPAQPSLNVSIHVDCLAVPASIVQWRSVRTHNGAGLLGIVLNMTASGNGLTGPTVETRSGGIQKIEVDFNQSVTLANTTDITVIGRTSTGTTLGTPISYTPGAVTLSGTSTLQIIFSPGALPDETCYTISLPADVVTVGLTGDRDVSVRSLYGDTTMSGQINLSDALLIKKRIGTNVIGSAQLDVDLSGAVASPDVQAARSHVSSPARQALCP